MLDTLIEGFYLTVGHKEKLIVALMSVHVIVFHWHLYDIHLTVQLLNKNVIHYINLKLDINQ